MQAPYCYCCQLALVSPVNFCPRCGTDQRAGVYHPVPAPTAAAAPGLRPDTLVYLILGWVFAMLALTGVSPVVLGPAAMVMGAVAWGHGCRQGMAIVFVAIAATGAGLLVTYAFDLFWSSDLSAAAEEALMPMML